MYIHSQATYTVKAYTQAMHIHSHGTTGTLARFCFAYQVRFCKLVPNLYEGIEQITFLMNDEKIAEFVVWVDSLRIRLCSEKYTCWYNIEMRKTDIFPLTCPIESYQGDVFECVFNIVLSHLSLSTAWRWGAGCAYNSLHTPPYLYFMCLFCLLGPLPPSAAATQS